MNIERIKEIVTNDITPTDIKESLILIELAKDENVIPDLMKILDNERRERKELMIDLNLYLSKAHVAITSPALNKNGFVQDEIIQFFIKNKNKKGIGHCFVDIDKI